MQSVLILQVKLSTTTVQKSPGGLHDNTEFLLYVLLNERLKYVKYCQPHLLHRSKFPFPTCACFSMPFAIAECVMMLILNQFPVIDWLFLEFVC